MCGLPHAAPGKGPCTGKSLAGTLLPILYGLLSVAYILIFFRNDPVARRLAPRALVGTLILHGIYIGLLAYHEKRVPIANSFEAMSALALALGIAYLIKNAAPARRTPGSSLCPSSSCARRWPRRREPRRQSIGDPRQPAFRGAHRYALLGYAAFAVSAIFGVLYVLLYHNLKAHRFGIIYERLPSLEVLSGMNLRAACFGWAA